MLSQFTSFIARHDLADAGDRVLVAVSGGLDSMVLIKLFEESGYAIGIAHANFELRGRESEEDEAFVRQYCKHAGIPFFTQAFETKNYAEASGLSIQMAARELRYTWFGKLLEAEKYHWLATAHHLNDNLETVLMRWTKGVGLDQLTGIPIKREKIIRPLLFATREEILQYAKSKKISWREDSSNTSDDYARNFIRHQVIPRLKEINPSLEETFAHSLDKIKGAYELMQRGLEQLKDSMTRNEGSQFLVDKNLLMLLKNPAFVCYEWLRPFGFEWERCIQMVASLQSQSGTQFLSATHQAVIDREFIVVTPLEAALVNEILIEEGQDKAALGPWRMTLKSHDGAKILTKVSEGTFDGARIKFPLVWRKWQKGDIFFPLGLGHRKKVSDFLIDEKVPLSTKNTVTVLASGGDVVWVVGHRVDDRFKVTVDSKNVLEVSVKHI